MPHPSEPVKGKLTILGAGPGDPELITLKGIRALRSADVLLYDALVNPDLLDHAPANSQKIYVGKKAGNHRYSQEEIHALISHFALQGLHVVRLKGGDPFVFGRGREEWAYAATLGITVDVIPGISSSIAVPEGAGIPLTHRKLAESFWVVTGTTSGNKLSDDLRLAAQSSATIVILMGLGKIHDIDSLLASHGKSDTPAAVISSGSTSDEKVILGKVNDIADKVHEAEITSPAIIVVGDVVALAEPSEWIRLEQTINAEVR